MPLTLNVSCFSKIQIGFTFLVPAHLGSPGQSAVNVYVCTYVWLCVLSGISRVGHYQKKHSPTHTHPDHRTSFINFLHLLWSIASSLFKLCAWQSFSTTSLRCLVYLLVLDPLLHTLCISSHNHHFIFAGHAHTIAPDNNNGNYIVWKAVKRSL